MGELDEPIEAPRNGRWKSEIPRDAKRDDMSRREVLSNDRRDDHARLTGFRSDDGRKKRQLITLRGAPTLDHHRAKKREVDVRDGRDGSVIVAPFGLQCG